MTDRIGVDMLNTTDEQVRFWSKVDKSGDCWLWLTSRSANGYGRFDRANGGRVMAHRAAFEFVVGPIPDGFQIDHLCRVRLCVNPSHLEAVTQQTNIARADLANGRREQCKHGHKFTTDNTYLTPNGRYQCRICIRARLAKSEAKRRAA